MSNDANKFVMFQGFNPEYFTDDVMVIVKPKPGKVLTINRRNAGDNGLTNKFLSSISLCGDQYIIGYVYSRTESTLTICIPSRKNPHLFTINASDRDDFTIERMDDVVITSKSEGYTITNI